MLVTEHVFKLTEASWANKGAQHSTARHSTAQHGTAQHRRSKAASWFQLCVNDTAVFHVQQKQSRLVQVYDNREHMFLLHLNSCDRLLTDMCNRHCSRLVFSLSPRRMVPRDMTPESKYDKDL